MTGFVHENKLRRCIKIDGPCHGDGFLFAVAKSSHPALSALNIWGFLFNTRHDLEREIGCLKKCNGESGENG